MINVYIYDALLCNILNHNPRESVLRVRRVAGKGESVLSVRRVAGEGGPDGVYVGV